MNEPQTYTARWVFPVAGPPLPGGTVTVRGDRIEAVSPNGERTPDVDLGNVALLPGLVNAHTHLDLSGARGRIPPTDPAHFTDWLRGVIAYRRSRTPEQTQADLRTGLAECLRAGTTLIGDIAAEGQSWDTLANAPTRAVVFHELIGLSQTRAEVALATAQSWLQAHPRRPITRSGLSPHAPYSAGTTLITGAGKLCRVGKDPLAIHLAEVTDEIQLLHARRGSFVEFLKGVNAWDADGPATSMASVMTMCDFRQPKLFIHANHVAPSARFPRNSSVVYCPRTHAAFQHPPHPFRDFLARGVRVCLGTDSLASNPVLDIFAEAQFLHERYPDFPPEQLLRMVTLSGAKALGWESEAGSLEPGKSADFVAMPLPNRESANSYDLLFTSDGERQTMFRGEWRSY